MPESPLPATGAPAAPAVGPRCPSVVELRQYTLRPGRRDELVELFDREFVESQEEVGMAVLGQFRDLDDPDRFVWLRGFRDMQERHRGLGAFYGGPVWERHGPAANATMVSSDDVLLLRPLAGAGPTARVAPRPAVGAPDPGGVVSAVVWSFPPGRREGADLVRDGLLPALRRTGPAPVAVLATEPAANTFPRLPVRTGENVVVALTPYPDEAARRRHLARLHGDRGARDEVLGPLERELTAPPQVLRLGPTARSLLR
ncbi:NIPSNAP family protein [Streptomyces kanasensis]|uniref:NIPSNAP family protein n=1 Tax=Streptomyces kanasensis TaxID=936756 RepID=UPI0038191441